MASLIGIYFLTINYLKKIERSACVLFKCDPMAILAMEISRTDNYGEYDSYDGETVCPVCGAFELEHYYINDDEECVGCSECVRKSDVMY